MKKTLKSSTITPSKTEQTIDANRNIVVVGLRIGSTVSFVADEVMIDNLSGKLYLRKDGKVIFCANTGDWVYFSVQER